MSELGLGLAALGRPAYITLGHADDVTDASVDGMERNAHAILDAAHAGGVRRFDAARSYGCAEAFLGSWLRARGLGRDDVYVSSKWGYRYTGGWRVDAEQHEVKDLSAAHLRAQWHQTVGHLGDHIRLYAIHSATLDSGVLDDPLVQQELSALRAGGLRIGLSTSGAGQAATIEHALEVGGFDAVQATWNLHDRSTGDVLARAHDRGLEVYVKEGVANGRLTARGGNATLAAAARARDATEDQVALAAVLAQPWADVVLSGAMTVEQLESNLGAARVAWDDELEEQLAGLEEEPEAYWATRSALPWN